MPERKRIALISEDLAEPWDEGIKKFAYSVARAFEVDNDVLLINVDRSGVGGKTALRVPGSRTFLSRTLGREIRNYVPDIVIYVPSPSDTTSSFLRSSVLRAIAPQAVHGMVALIPRDHPKIFKPLLRKLAPHVVWVPSYRSLLYLSKLSVNGEVIPVGVDLEQYKPAAEAEKVAARQRLGLSPDKFVVLHVGHLSKKRNINVLASLRETPGVEAVVIASTSTADNPALRESLTSRGVRVIRETVDVTEYYHAADCYVFPVMDSEGCVEMPLSVLEALACGLPVLTTPFGGLRDFFDEGEDVRYWTSPEELSRGLAAMMDGPPPQARNMGEFSWDQIADRLLESLNHR